MRTDRAHKLVGANERERQVMELVAAGLNNREMANAMGISEHLIKYHLRSLYDRLGLWNRLELALWYEAHRIPSWSLEGDGRPIFPTEITGV
ncbi:MAG: helix-turn-helix transcriptional regulator [Candidatus Sulfotelmatobacter sp.]